MTNQSLETDVNKIWQVICGDRDHWRVGIYSPEFSNIGQVQKLEKHSCPEFFMLLEGELTLVLDRNNKLELLKLEKFKPILVDTWHTGFSPQGPFKSKALVVERDTFTTKYRAIKDLTAFTS